MLFSRNILEIPFYFYYHLCVLFILKVLDSLIPRKLNVLIHNVKRKKHYDGVETTSEN